MLHHIRHMLGRVSGASASLSDGSYSDTDTDPADALAFFKLAASGAFTAGDTVVSGSGGYSWLSGGNASDFEARLTMVSGTSFTNAALNSWLNLGTDREWRMPRTSVGSASGTATLEIRPAGGGAVLASATISLTALVEAGGGGGDGTLDSQLVTVGADGSTIEGNRRRGYVSGVIGSVADGSSNLYGGAAIRKIAAVQEGDPGSPFDVVLEITGVVANSGWTTMTVGGLTVLSRASATFATGTGNSVWTWAAVGNPFGQAGTKYVDFD